LATVAIMLGCLFSLYPSLSFMIPVIKNIQQRVSMLFEAVFILIPVLVFFVILNFLTQVGLEHSNMVIQYFMLAISFVVIMNFIIFPWLFYSLLGVSIRSYVSVVSPIVLMTFLAGDSIAAIPLIAKHADNFGAESDLSVSRMLTLVVICFPWVGELANLTFPIYSAFLEGYNWLGILKILSVGPFFMFTDPYISIPALLDSFAFPDYYRTTYMTLALLTDHMFEVSEAIAVFLVVCKLKTTLYPHGGEKSSH